jgi:hypothetical protein
MQSIPHYYFDTLSNHLKPRRLAALNGVSHVNSVSSLLGIDHDTVLRFADYPLLSIQTATLQIDCQELELLATTLYFVAKKFGRSLQPSSLGRFFAGSLEAYQRYCPRYLSKADYYPLTGCPAHRYRLLDRCGHCGNFIPLFPIRAPIGICTRCEENLRSSPTLTLTTQEINIVHRYTFDFEYLLSPHGNEEDRDGTIAYGLRCKGLRKTKQVDFEEVVEEIAVSPNSLKGIEQGINWILAIQESRSCLDDRLLEEA